MHFCYFVIFLTTALVEISNSLVWLGTEASEGQTTDAQGIPIQLQLLPDTASEQTLFQKCWGAA